MISTIVWLHVGTVRPALSGLSTHSAARAWAAGLMALVVAPVLWTAPVRAQMDPLGEQDIVALARAHAPAYRTATAQTGRAEAAAAGIGAWPNPELSWEREETFEPGPGVEDSLSITVPVDLSGRRGVRRALSELDAADARGEGESSRADALTHAVNLFYRVLALERRVSLHTEAQSQLQNAAEVLERREAAGEASGYATARLALEAELSRSRLAELRLSLQSRRTELRTHLGLDSDRELPLEGTFDVAVPGAVQDLLRDAEGRRPELMSRRWALAAARRARGSAGTAWLPSLALTGGYRRVAESSVSHGYVFGLSLDLPLFDHGQGERARAAAAMVSAETDEDVMRGVVSGEVVGARASLTGLLAERARFADRSAHTVEELLLAAQSGFAGGERTLVELIDARRAALAVSEHLLDLDLGIRLADVALRRATGDLR